MQKIPLVCLIVFGALAPAVHAIVMRHDREEAEYVELARRFPATVSFLGPGEPQRWGVGTLIDPYWVLTAGHVADQVQPGDPVKIGDATLAVERVVQYPDWKGGQPGKT